MPAALLTFLLNPKVIASLGVALLLSFAAIQTARLGNAKRDQIDPTTHKAWKYEELRDGTALSIAKRDLTVCQSNFDMEDAALTRQNAAVEALQAQGAQATARAAKAAQQALMATKTASDLAVTILAPHPDHSCSAAEKLIDGAVQ